MKTSGFRPFLAGIAGMVALVLWGMIFWGWLYEPFGIFHKLPDDTEVVEMLIANDTQTGTYFFPWPRNTPDTFASFVQQHQTGPFFQLSYLREGVDPQSPGKILRGVLQYFVVSMIAVRLIRLAPPAETPFIRKFAVIFLAGLMGTVFIRLGDPIWFHLPWQHALGNAFFEIVSWILMGVVIAALMRH